MRGLLELLGPLFGALVWLLSAQPVWGSCRGSWDLCSGLLFGISVGAPVGAPGASVWGSCLGPWGPWGLGPSRGLGGEGWAPEQQWSTAAVVGPGAVSGALGRGGPQWVTAAAAAVGPGTVRGAWGGRGGMGLGRGWYIYIYIYTLVFVLAVQCILIFVYIHNIYIRVHV